MTGGAQARPLSGRVTEAPGEIVHDEVLEPQFSFEAAHYLRFYVLVEKVLLLEYERMGLLGREETAGIAEILHGMSAADLTAAAGENLSDIAFAMERVITRQIADLPPAWHVDRSRNDLQACAQLLFGREMLARSADGLVGLVRTLHARIPSLVDLPMPGYTHMQAAQVVSPGFHLAAMADQVLRSLTRLGQVYDGMDASPLGAGAMSGRSSPGTGTGWRHWSAARVRRRTPSAQSPPGAGSWRRGRSSRAWGRS
ncbi:lyase family protein [Nocardiopsis sp. ARC36]